MFCSSSTNKLKREAFLPPPDKCDVSVLRYIYTNDSFCKEHAKALSIPNNVYKGLATFKAIHVIEASNKINNGLTAQVKGTPIDSKGNYIEKKPVFETDLGLPMHADLLYSEVLIRREPNTKHREIANALLKTAKYFPDPNVHSHIWEGKSLNEDIGQTG